MDTVLERILEEKIVAILRGIPGERILPLVQALLAGGIHCVEVTFDQSAPEKEVDTLAAIRLLKDHFADTLCVGAGTVLTSAQVCHAAEAGAQYIISPDTRENVIRKTKALGLVSIPGAMTPTEIVQAHDWGADIVKVFPADQLGAGFLKAIRSPLKHIPMMAVGGVTKDNCGDFLRAGAVCVGVGGNLVRLELLDGGKTEEITAVARAYCRELREV